MRPARNSFHLELVADAFSIVSPLTRIRSDVTPAIGVPSPEVPGVRKHITTYLPLIAIFSIPPYYVFY
jgi:hypothetical protein